MAVSPSKPSKPTQEHNQETHEAYRKAAASTLASIREIVSPAQLTFYSNRSIAEVEALQEEVSAVVPAGNVVGLVLGGLLRLRGRTLPADQARSDVSALMRALELLPRHVLPSTIYSTFFVAPAAVLAAYQKLLTLAGKDLNSAFPDGLWQFYLEFALREDSARHANETVGFQQALRDYNLVLSQADQVAAWVCAASQVYFQYDELLANEWRERVCLNLLEEAVGQAGLGHKLSFQRLPQAWAAQRPYQRGHDASHAENYSGYRRRRFDSFWQGRLEYLPQAQQTWLAETYARRAAQELPAYQQQMTLLMSLNPDRYREVRRPVPLWQARIGVIHNDRYYLLPACQVDPSGRPILFEQDAEGSGDEAEGRAYPLQPDPAGVLLDPARRRLQIDRAGQAYLVESGQPAGRLRPVPFQAVRRQVAAIFADRPVTGPAQLDSQLLAIRRPGQEAARKELKSEMLQQELACLKCTPILINWDEQDAARPLAYIRQARRGLGDHALTIFRTGQSMVFDQSHIVFDGTWGMAVAEILTGEAVSWAAYFASLPAPEPATGVPYSPRLARLPALDKFPAHPAGEVSAESSGIEMKDLLALCRLLPRRHPDLKLTVNDLLILYRSEFGHEYRPSTRVEDALYEFHRPASPEVQAIYTLIDDALTRSQARNPSMMIPMDATAVSPRERLYPTTFRNPFTGLWTMYQQAAAALNAYTGTPDGVHWAAFTEARRALLAQLNYFGQVVRSYKRVALEGGSTSVATLKLMAHLPDSFLKFLDEIPRRIDVLNEVIKGEEVFSNVGRVARGSSLTRFISAKDDNENKTLVWGVLTDDRDVLRLTLRDFRPYTAALRQVGRADLAELILADYLESFVAGFNQFIACLLAILNATATHST